MPESRELQASLCIDITACGHGVWELGGVGAAVERGKGPFKTTWLVEIH